MFTVLSQSLVGSEVSQANTETDAVCILFSFMFFDKNTSLTLFLISRHRTPLYQSYLVTYGGSTYFDELCKSSASQFLNSISLCS